EHGCPDASESLDLSQCEERPIAFGGFGDIYYGKTKDGVPVAIKCARVSVNEMIEHSTLKAVAKELHAWSKCKHENVIELIGLTLFRGQLATLSPWMVNRAIPHYLAKHPDADRFKLEVMTGKVPYEGQTDLAVCGQVLARRTLPPRPPRDTITYDIKGDIIWHTIASCWAYCPSDRPTARELVQRVRNPLAFAATVQITQAFSSKKPKDYLMCRL
ncbi:hypothetical protein FRC07_008045, partial [Ceratobasidium sp. 392]